MSLHTSIAKLSFVTLVASSWLLVSLSSTPLLAASDAPLIANASLAKTELRQRLEAISSLQSTFTQTVTDEANNLIHSSSGNLVLQQPNRVYWHAQVPDETLVIANGDKVFYVDDFVEQVSIFNQADMVSDNPLMLLTSTDDKVWEQFSVTQQADSFEVTPSSTQGQIQALTLVFTQGELRAFTLLDNQAQRSEFVLSNITMNMPLPVSQFQYDIPVGYSIDDQTQP
jgi:outer membrane lipoprotein carrier protein